MISVWGRGCGGRRYVLSELAANDIRKDLELLVPVRAEASVGRDAILVYDTQSTMLLMGAIAVPAYCEPQSERRVHQRDVRCEGERVKRLQPAMVRTAALMARTRNDLDT